MPTAVVQHSTQTGIELHEDKRIKEPVRAASTANITLSAPGGVIDGVTMSAGDRFGAFGQTTASEGGIYVWNGAAVAASRASDAAVAAHFVYLFQVGVREGTVNGLTRWTFTQTGAITVGTTALTFARDSSPTFVGEVAATDFKATGLTGSVAASRYVGATATGAPTTGAHVLGDYVVDQTGKIWICTSAGTPGTWVQSDTTAASFTATGLTGAVAASRYAGATTGGAPTGGTFAVGDTVVDQTGKIWICTSAGTPGTWVQSGSVISGGANGQALSILALTELTTIAAAATTTTAIQIPAGAIVLAVSVRVTVVIPTAATFTVIGNTSTTVFQTAAVSTAANSTDPGTAAGAFYSSAAQTIRITPNLTPAANTGRVRVTIFYLLSTPPTS